jgi:hypothetical protein
MIYSGRATYQHALRRVGVVQRGLNDVVGKRVPKKLFQTASVEKLANEDLSELRVGNSDALAETN